MEAEEEDEGKEDEMRGNEEERTRTVKEEEYSFHSVLLQTL